MDLRFLRWLIGHVDDAQKIVSAIEVAIAEPTPGGKVLALHPVLDALAKIVDDFPVGFGATTEENEPEFAAQVRAEAAARKIDWAKLLDIAEKLLPILLMLFAEEKPQA